LTEDIQINAFAGAIYFLFFFNSAVVGCEIQIKHNLTSIIHKVDWTISGRWNTTDKVRL